METDGGGLIVGWAAPSDDGGAPVTRYQVRYGRVGEQGRDPATWNRNRMSVTAPATSTTITGLSAGTTFAVQVRAKNRAGWSAWSESGTGTAAAPALPVVPALKYPQHIKVAAVSNDRVTLQWFSIGWVSEYKVRYMERGSSSWVEAITSPNPKKVGEVVWLISDVSLASNKTYEIQIRALGDGVIYAAEWGPWSESVVAHSGPPPAPTALTVGAATLTSVSLSWDPVEGANGYEVKYSAVGATTGSIVKKASDASYTATGLDHGTEYGFSVRARGDGTRYANGYGDWSGVPPGRVLTPTVTSGNGRLAVSWDAPSSGSSSITRYEIQHKQSAHSSWPTTHSTTTPTVTGTKVSGLTNGTSYDVRLRACNSAGCGGWSFSENATPSANRRSLPAKPAGLAANGNIVNERVSLRWKASAGATDYNLRYAVETCTDTPQGTASVCAPGLWNEVNAVTATTTTLSAGADDSRLSSSTVYRLQVRATNAYGPSDWSDITFVFPTDSALGHGTDVATAPFHGYQAKNAQGSHEFRYVLCTETIPTGITMTAEKMKDAVDEWEDTVIWKTGSVNIISTTAYSLGAGERCSTSAIPRKKGRFEVKFRSSLRALLNACDPLAISGPGPPGCWRSLSWTRVGVDKITEGAVHLNAGLGAAYWNRNLASGCPRLYETLVHEVGHAFGIGNAILNPLRPELNRHPTNTTHSIMSYEDPRNYCEPQAYDILAIMALYQSR